MERACGLDVHKDSVFSCIISENGEIISKKFGMLTPDLEELRRHLVENHVDAAAMESTSIYWMPVWYALDGSGVELKLVNPYFIRQLPGRKSDVKDTFASRRSLDQTRPHSIDYVMLGRIKNTFFRGKIWKKFRSSSVKVKRI